MKQLDVEVSVDGAALQASLALPDTDGPHAGVLVLHEIFGLNDDIRRIAARFAAEGYVALAPDLYSRSRPRALCVARTVLAMLRGHGAALGDLDAAVGYLRARPEVRADRIGVAGFCMGGGFALLVALSSKLQVAAPYYGEVPGDANALAGICPVVGGFGAEDRIFAPQGRRLERHLDVLGVPHDVRVYPGAGHSYMSQHEPHWYDGLAKHGPMRVGYNQAAADDSWRRMLAFFSAHLEAA